MSEIMLAKEYLLKATSAVIRKGSFEVCQDINFEKVYKLAKRNVITGILYSAASNTFSGNLAEILSKEYKMSVLRNIEQETEIERIRKEFTENNIDFIFLKGTHLKELYPAPELRFMVDMDILVHPEDHERAIEIIISHGLQKKMESDKDIALIKPPFLTVEVHKSLFHPDYKFYEHFLDVWEKAEKVSKNEYKMSDNDLYVYTLTHLCEHYLEAGSLFRPCMDIYLLKQNRELDFDYINSRFSEVGILEFANKISILVECMFEGKEKDDTLTLMENYIVIGPPVKSASEATKVATTGQSKFKRILYMLFPNYKHMAYKYDILKKMPILLPLFWMVRIVSILCSKDSAINKKKSDIINVDQKSADIMSEIFKKSGL